MASKRAKSKGKQINPHFFIEELEKVFHKAITLNTCFLRFAVCLFEAPVFLTTRFFDRGMARQFLHIFDRRYRSIIYPLQRNGPGDLSGFTVAAFK